jgi:hypothetical protein
MKKSIKQKLIEHMDNGYCLCNGYAITLTKAQSADRRLREIIEADPGKYCFFWSKGKNGADYKVFMQRRCKTSTLVTYMDDSETGKISYCKAAMLNDKKIVKSHSAPDALVEKLVKPCKVSK